MKNKFIITLIYIVFFFNSNLLTRENNSVLKVGLLAPLSGSYSELGNSFIYSLQLALEEIGDKNVIIVPRDSGFNNKKKLNDAIQDIRSFTNVFRNLISSIVQSIFGVFLNILTQFQFILIKMKDMLAKIVGIMASMMFILQGSVMTMHSTWNGPPGQMVRLMSKMKI